VPEGPAKKNKRGHYPWPRPIPNVTRIVPETFEVYKSEFWVVMHR
jgi:hypothetical protein